MASTTSAARAATRCTPRTRTRWKRSGRSTRSSARARSAAWSSSPPAPERRTSPSAGCCSSSSAIRSCGSCGSPTRSRCSISRPPASSGRAHQLPAGFERTLRIFAGDREPTSLLDRRHTHVACATIQTISRKLDRRSRRRTEVSNFLKGPTVVIVDEAHHVASSSYQTAAGPRGRRGDPRRRGAHRHAVGPGRAPGQDRRGLPAAGDLAHARGADRRGRARRLHRHARPHPPAHPGDGTGARAGRARRRPPDDRPAQARDAASATRSSCAPTRTRAEAWGRTLLFTTTIENADDACSQFKAAGIDARALHSQSEATLSDLRPWLKEHPQAVLISVGMLLEGRRSPGGANRADRPRDDQPQRPLADGRPCPARDRGGRRGDRERRLHAGRLGRLHRRAVADRPVGRRRQRRSPGRPAGRRGRGRRGAAGGRRSRAARAGARLADRARATPDRRRLRAARRHRAGLRPPVRAAARAPPARRPVPLARRRASPAGRRGSISSVSSSTSPSTARRPRFTLSLAASRRSTSPARSPTTRRGPMPNGRRIIAAAYDETRSPGRRLPQPAALRRGRRALAAPARAAAGARGPAARTSPAGRRSRGAPAAASNRRWTS